MSASESTTEHKDTTTWKESPFLLIKGFLMGSADIVPGVSGGTMALILGIYSRLIYAIKSVGSRFARHFFTLKFRQAMHTVHWRFLLFLLSGIVTAILFFTKVVPLQVYMYTQPELIYGLFFGLIVGSIYILVKELGEFSAVTHGLSLAAGIGLGFAAVNLVPVETPNTHLYVFFSGAIAICAMILPGISGSYILLILKKYDFILSKVGDLGGVDTLPAVITLGFFIVGAVCGLAVFSRLLSWLLDHYYTATLALLVGFLIGSLYMIWPYQQREYREIVTKTRIIEYNDPIAVKLRSDPPDGNRPEYRRLGEVINPQANFDELKKVELLTIKRKLIKTEPFIPYLTTRGAGTGSFWQGIWGVGVGLILVMGLDYLRSKN